MSRKVPAAPQTRSTRLTEQERGAFGGFLRVHAVVTHCLDERLRERHGLHLNEYEVLLILSEAPQPLRATELAQRTVLTPGGVTRLVDRLIERGFLERRACETDARGVMIALTDAGRDAFTAAGRDHLTDIRSLFLSHLDREGVAMLDELWSRVLGGSPVQ